jgi:hypothetical protein
LTERYNDKDDHPMPLIVHYPCQAGSEAPAPLSFADIRAVAAQVRRQIARDAGAYGLTVEALLQASREVEVNGRAITALWDVSRPVHDEGGRPVLGVCGTEPEDRRHAFLAVNAEMTANRPDLVLSTAAHELGHLIFDVPAALHRGGMRYRAVATSSVAFDRLTRDAEGRANEFMGALLAPAMALHTRLLKHAQDEGLRMVRGRHQGRPGGRILAAGNPEEAVAGVIA